MRFIIRAPRRSNLACGLILAFICSARGHGEDIHGIWMVENNADASLERAHVVIDPEDGKIPYRPEALARQKQNFASRASADPRARCFQPGVPRAAYERSPFQIFQNDRAVYIVYQDVHAFRIIYLDGSKHNEGLGYAMGDSRGHWEGNTLVVDVTSFSDATWLDAAGDYHSAELHVIERYTRTGSATLTYEATIEDPKVFTRPWKIRMPLRMQKGIQIMEDECEEGGDGRRHHVPLFKQAPNPGETRKELR